MTLCRNQMDQGELCYQLTFNKSHHNKVILSPLCSLKSKIYPHITYHTFIYKALNIHLKISRATISV